MQESRIHGIGLPSAMIVERGHTSRPRVAPHRRKFISLAIVGIMVLMGFGVLGPSVSKSGNAPAAAEQPEPAKALAGSREATYTIDHMFELYEKSHDPVDLGRWNGTMGLNGWWPLREMLYQEYQARASYPYVLVYNPYSTQTTPDIDQGGSISTWYRMTIDAKNLTEIADGPNMDPIFTPVLGPTNIAGGWMNISWYGTYLETWELQAITNGTHYANTYYGVPAAVTPRPSSDDGYWHELQGKLTFNRAAAGKILGLTAAGDLRTQFSASETAIETAWFNDWMTEGGPGGIYDIYTAYDYSDDIRWLELKVDPASTADILVLRFWSISWGNEILLVRYMEAANVQKNWQGWPDDWYLNVTIGPNGGNVHSRAVMGYQMHATKDSINNVNGWALEATHIDWCGNAGMHYDYYSPFNAYDPRYTDATHISWAPLTRNFGKPVSYMEAPLHWNLTSGETFIVKLPSVSTMLPGYHPKASTSDLLGPAKIAEMAGNVTWGQMVAGNGYPNSGTNNLKNFYSQATKTYTLVGPLDFAKNWNPSFPGLLETGAPMFVMNVVPSFTLHLVTGWNLVSIPLVGYRSSTIGLTNGDTIVRWNEPGQYYQSHVIGVPNDFAIEPSTGYWINIPSGTRTLTLYGVVPTVNQSRPVNLPVGGGWALIGFASLKTTWHAKDVPAMYSVPGIITMVASYDPPTKTYTPWLSIIPNRNNFQLGPGQGYWILCGSSGVLTYTP